MKLTDRKIFIVFAGPLVIVLKNISYHMKNSHLSNRILLNRINFTDIL